MCILRRTRGNHLANRGIVQFAHLAMRYGKVARLWRRNRNQNKRQRNIAIVQFAQYSVLKWGEKRKDGWCAYCTTIVKTQNIVFD